MYGVTLGEAQSLLAAGRTDDLVEKVWSAFTDYRRGKELCIVEGAALPGVGNQLELNARLAAELGAPVLMIVDQHRDDRLAAREMANRALIAAGELRAEHADVLGAVLNKVQPGRRAGQGRDGG
jgi:BioD-like phosphotransacetylase family protein